MKRLVFHVACAAMMGAVVPEAGAFDDDDLLMQMNVSPPQVTTTGLHHRVYVPPEYPREAWRRNQEGWVEVELTVEAGGRVTDARVLASHPRGLFERAALRAVRQWQFEPIDAGIAEGELRGTFRVEFRRNAD